VVIENKEHFSAWHQVLLVCSLPSLVTIIGFVFLLESPRYLLEAGREVEAMMVYQVIIFRAVLPRSLQYSKKIFPTKFSVHLLPHLIC
jgi:Sugar (and other) transporter.